MNTEDPLDKPCLECDHTRNYHPDGGECIAGDCECITFEDAPDVTDATVSV